MFWWCAKVSVIAYTGGNDDQNLNLNRMCLFIKQTYFHHPKLNIYMSKPFVMELLPPHFVCIKNLSPFGCVSASPKINPEHASEYHMLKVVNKVNENLQSL